MKKVYFTIKSLIRYKFKSNKELKDAINLYLSYNSFEEAYKIFTYLYGILHDN